MLLTYIEHLVSFPDHHMDHRHSYGVESKNPAWVWSFQIPCSMSMACLKLKKKFREINEINFLPFLKSKTFFKIHIGIWSSINYWIQMASWQKAYQFDGFSWSPLS